MGKTAFTLNIAQHAAIEHNVPVAFFSLEMSKESLVQRMLTSEARIDAQRLRKGMLRDDDFPRLARAAGILSSAPVWIDDTPGITLLEMRSKARRLKAESGVGMVIVDYLQLMQGPANSESRQQEVSQISRGLKALAKELNVPVVALSQLSRAPEQRTGDNKRPQLSDLRESGAIEQDADLIMFLYRQEFYDGPVGQGRQLARGQGRGDRRQAAQRSDRHRESVLSQAVHALRELHAARLTGGDENTGTTTVSILREECDSGSTAPRAEGSGKPLLRLPESMPPRSSSTGRMVPSSRAGARWSGSIPMERPPSSKGPLARDG